MFRIAKVLKSNGISGDLLVSAPEVGLAEITGPVFIEFDGLPVPFFIEKCAPKGGKYIIHLTDIDSLQDAEEVVGAYIFSEEQCCADAEDDEADFSGWKVFDSEHYIGKVSGIAPIPGNYCLCIERPEGDEIMIPLHPDFITDVRKEKEELVLSLPEGLY
ncbi:MAG: ribosome maturation factor RimM [Candidatus Cryptobacteroides sp.]